MKKSWRWKAALIATEAFLLLGVGLLLQIDRTEWIIRFGILGADRLIVTLWVGWIAISVLGNLALLAAWLKEKKRRAFQEVKLTFSPDRAQKPDEIRGELTRFIKERPQLEPFLAQGIDQLDNIARKKEKMAELLERNELSLLSQAAGALDDAEQTLCRKLILVLNRALLCDPEEENARRKKAVYDEHARHMQIFLAENEEALNQCETLLSETVRYVEAKKAGRDGMDLKIMTDVIRSLSGDGMRMETQEGENRG